MKTLVLAKAAKKRLETSAAKVVGGRGIAVPILPGITRDTVEPIAKDIADLCAKFIDSGKFPQVNVTAVKDQIQFSMAMATRDSNMLLTGAKMDKLVLNLETALDNWFSDLDLEGLDADFEIGSPDVLVRVNKGQLELCVVVEVDGAE